MKRSSRVRGWSAGVLLALVTALLGACGGSSGSPSGDDPPDTGADAAVATQGGRDGGPGSAVVDGGAPEASATDAGDTGDAGADADAATPSISVTDASIAEGSAEGSALTFEVTLSAPAIAPVTVAFATSDGTASAAAGPLFGADYVGASGVLTFAPGETQKSVVVQVNADTTSEPDETMTLTLSGASGATIADGVGVGTIVDDDPLPSLSVADTTVIEGRQATFEVTLSAISERTITVQASTVAGTALAPADFTAVDVLLTFAPGDKTKRVAVDTTGDVLVEPNETFSLQLAAPSHASLATSLAICTIQDDDGASLPLLGIGDATVIEGSSGATTATLTVKLSAPSADVVTVGFDTKDGSATAADGDYEAATGTVTFAPGETEKTLDVLVKGDTVSEPTETFTVVLSGAKNALIDDAVGVVTITDDDGAPVLSIADASVSEGQAGATNLTFLVSLSAASGKTITVQFATSDGTATSGGDAAKGGQDYAATTGQLSLPPGKTEVTVTVPVLGDLLNEGDETFFVTLSAPVNATVGASPKATGTIVNDDPLPLVQVSPKSALEGNAGQTTMTFEVALYHPAVDAVVASGRAVTVHYATADGTATSGVDYLATSGDITFAPGEAKKNVSVAILGDTLEEPNETFSVVLSAPVNAALAPGAPATGTIVDDDAALPALSIEGEKVLEGSGGTTKMTFTVAMSKASPTPVTVTYASVAKTATAGGDPLVGGDDFVPVSGTLTFAPGETMKTIPVTIVADLVHEAEERLDVVLSNPSANATIQSAVGTGAIEDDDASPTVSIADVSAPEGNAGTSVLNFVAKLSSASGEPFHVAYATSNGTATTTGTTVSGGNDYVPASGVVKFMPGETTKTISIVMNGDTTYEANETITMTLSSPFTAYKYATAVGTIVNDDPVPTLSIANLSLFEGTPAPGTPSVTTFPFVVTLSNPRNANVTVHYATADGTATSGSDYVADSGVVTFSPGETSKLINIAVKKDAVVEGNEVFYVNLFGVLGATLSNNQAIGQIKEDDLPL